MKLYIEKLFTPNTSKLEKPKKNILHIIICEEGIIYHGNKDQKLIIHDDSSNKHRIYTLDNVKLIEDNTKIILKPIYNISLHHYMVTLKQEIYSIKNIKFVIEYHNEKLYNMYFQQYNIANDQILIENTLKLIKMKY